MVHGDAAVLDAADEDAELVLAFHVLDQLGLDAEAPHLLQIVARQLHLVQRLGADLDHLVAGNLPVRVLKDILRQPYRPYTFVWQRCWPSIPVQ